MWLNMKSLSPLANTGVPHPEIRTVFTSLVSVVSTLAASAGAAWAGFRRDPSESPQPGAIHHGAGADRCVV